MLNYSCTSSDTTEGKIKFRKKGGIPSVFLFSQTAGTSANNTRYKMASKIILIQSGYKSSQSWHRKDKRAEWQIQWKLSCEDKGVDVNKQRYKWGPNKSSFKIGE